MTQQYHNTTVFQPATEVDREKFEARLKIIGRRLERYLDRKFRPILNIDHADMDDLIQGALMYLWRRYQRQPEMMDFDDWWWLHRARSGAQSMLQQLRRQCGKRDSRNHHYRVIIREKAQMHYTDGTDHGDGELLDFLAARTHRHHSTHGIEAYLADQRIDLERLCEAVLAKMTPRQQQVLRKTIPLLAEGYTLNEIARKIGVDQATMCEFWKFFRQHAGEISGEKIEPRSGRGFGVRPDEMAAIRDFAEQGLSLREIGTRIGRCTPFVAKYFEQATGYRRGSTATKCAVTPERVAAMRTLRQAGHSFTAIAKQLGCSPATVTTWLNK